MSLPTEDKTVKNTLSIPDILADFFLKKIEMGSYSDDSSHKHRGKRKRSKHKKGKYKKSKHRSRSSSREPEYRRKDKIDDVSSSEEISIKRLKKIKNLKLNSKINPVLQPKASNFLPEKTHPVVSATGEIPIFYGPSLEMLLSGSESNVLNVDSISGVVNAKCKENRDLQFELDKTKKFDINSQLSTCSETKNNASSSVSENIAVDFALVGDASNRDNTIFNKGEQKWHENSSANVCEKSDKSLITNEINDKNSAGTNSKKNNKDSINMSRVNDSSSCNAFKDNTYDSINSDKMLGSNSTIAYEIGGKGSPQVDDKVVSLFEDIKDSVNVPEKSDKDSRNISRKRCNETTLSFNKDKKDAVKELKGKESTADKEKNKNSSNYKDVAVENRDEDKKKNHSRSRSRSKSKISKSSSLKTKSKRSRSSSRDSHSRTKRRCSRSLSRDKSKLHRKQSHSRSRSRSKYSKSMRSHSRSPRGHSRRSRSRSHSKRKQNSSSRSRQRSRSIPRDYSASKSRNESNVKSHRRSRSHSRSASRSRNESKSKSGRKTRSRSRSKSKSKQLSKNKEAYTLKSRSKSKERKSNRIDQAKILETAKRNVLKMMKDGTLPEGLNVENLKKEQMVTIQTSGKSVQELTDFCQRLSQKENEPDDKDDKTQNSDSDNDTGFIHHPFKVKEPAMIKLNIKNAVQLPIKTHSQKIAELSSQFPVSSGNQHKQKELEWIPVVPNPPKTEVKSTDKKTVTNQNNMTAVALIENPVPSTPLLPTPLPTPEVTTVSAAPILPLLPPPMPPQLYSPSMQSRALLPLPPPPQPERNYAAASNQPMMMPNIPMSSSMSTPSTSIFKPPRKIDISSIVAKRFQALTKLQQNSNDPDALATLQDAQQDIQDWVESQQVPGLFTGSTDAKMLSVAELCGPKYYSKFRKNLVLLEPIIVL